MNDFRLMPSQIKQLFDEFVKYFDPNYFQIDIGKVTSYNGDYQYTVIKYKNSDYYCNFEEIYPNGNRKMTICPGMNNIVEEKWFDHLDSGKLITIFKIWLMCLQREVNTPKIWQTLFYGESGIGNNDPSQNNSSFSKNELLTIHKELADIKTQILAIQEFTTIEKQNIDEQFDYLKESSERLGRKDWKNILASSFFQLALSLAFSPENLRLLLQISKPLIDYILGTMRALGAG